MTKDMSIHDYTHVHTSPSAKWSAHPCCGTGVCPLRALVEHWQPSPITNRFNHAFVLLARDDDDQLRRAYQEWHRLAVLSIARESLAFGLSHDCRSEECDDAGRERHRRVHANRCTYARNPKSQSTSLRNFSAILKLAISLCPHRVSRELPMPAILALAVLATISMTAPTGSFTLVLHLQLSSSQDAALESLFWAVSTPTNARYLQHASLDTLARLIGAMPTAVDEATSFLERAGGTAVQVSALRTSVSARFARAPARWERGIP